ncbi:MAG: hypothetical protein HON70_15355, partial [Lentisphaerae bacterium]|nr:hypothetical protein [Lentisphaerota bacterium]
LPTPVIIPDRPWEDQLVLIFGRAIYDEQESVFKMWYAAGADYKLVCYATSTDGITWDKPDLDAVLIDGKPTNVILFGRDTTYLEPFGVVKDLSDPDSARRYKLSCKSAIKPYRGPLEHPHMPESRRGAGTYISPDGIHWTLENAFTEDMVCDISHYFQEPEDGSFVMHTRDRLSPGNNDGRWATWGWGRAVARIDSPDLRTWTKGKLVFAADQDDPEGSEIYSLAVFPCAGRYLGLSQMFYGLEDQCLLDVQLVTSNDAWTFERVDPRTPFIAEGGIGSWDRFNISIGDMPPVDVGDEHWFYYSGRNYRHGPYSGPDTSPKEDKWTGIGLARIKRGRFLSFEASFDGGTVTSTPFVLNGNVLELNANARYGSVEVELRDHQGNPLEGWTSTVEGQDGTAVPVAFPIGSVSELAGQTVQAHFTIRNAQLYGFNL